MNRVVKILMERDGMTEEEAKAEVRAGRQEMLEALEYGEDLDDMMSDLFGLEPDYLFDVL